MLAGTATNEGVGMTLPAVSVAAYRLHHNAITYCIGAQTHTRIPVTDLQWLRGYRGELVEELVTAGWWHLETAGLGYRIERFTPRCSQQRRPGGRP